MNSMAAALSGASGEHALEAPSDLRSIIDVQHYQGMASDSDAHAELLNEPHGKRTRDKNNTLIVALLQIPSSAAGQGTADPPPAPTAAAKG
jgi:hypothetical protein